MKITIRQTEIAIAEIVAGIIVILIIAWRIWKH
jgi:hypothetical protein